MSSSGCAASLALRVFFIISTLPFRRTAGADDPNGPHSSRSLLCSSFGASRCRGEGMLVQWVNCMRVKQHSMGNLSPVPHPQRDSAEREVFRKQSVLVPVEFLALSALRASHQANALLTEN